MRPASALPLAAILFSLAFAGCVSNEDVAPATDADTARTLAPLTEATHGFGEFLRLKVPSFDGVKIHVDVQLPDGEGPFPTIAQYTPYSVLGEQQWAVEHENGLETTVDAFVSYGYAVAVIHVRGTGESEGCLTVGGPEEGKDGYAAVEYLAEQPWSNGKIGLWGTSYVGTTPIETAVLNPPHLTTIVPISAVTSWYRYYFENGEQRMNGSPPPGASYPDPLFWIAMGVAPGVRTGAASADDATCPAEMMQNFWLQDDNNAYWQARDHGAQASAIQASVLYVQGWKDENVASNMAPHFWPNVTSEKRAWLTQHGHGIGKPEFHDYLHRWFDHWLLDLDNGALDTPMVTVEDNRGQWRGEAQWPPADVQGTRFWLATGGALAPEAPEDGARTYRDDGAGRQPNNAVRPVTDATEARLEGVTFLRFETAAFEADTLIAGEPVVHLEGTSDATDTQFTVLAYDRAPDGTLSFLTRGYLDARHREDLTQGKDVEPGKRLAYEWNLHPRDHVIASGHTLVVFVRSSDPYIIPDNGRAMNTIHFGAEGSWIELPTVLLSTRVTTDAFERPAEWDA